MSSLYNSASLVMIPSGYKDDKLYSIKPTDGSGDFTFSRDGAGASPATRVNASGLIEKGRENIILQSQTFDNASWFKTRTTASANVTTAPDGTTTADKLQDADTTTGDHLTFQIPTTSGTRYTFSGYFKKAEYNFVTVHAFGLSGGTFNLDTGVVVSSFGGISSIVADVSGWYRCSFTFTATGASVFISQSPSGNKNYTGITGSGIFVWGAQLEQGLVATDYIETTTTAVSAGLLGDMPRLDYSGGASCPSLLLEPSRTNAVTSSEYFDGGSLLNNTITASYNTADTLSPEGVYNAAKLTATGSFPRYYDYPSTADNTDIVISSFAKAGDASVYSLFASDKNLDAAQVYFDLSAGTATLAGTSTLTPVGYDIEPMGNGWYRCWLSINTGTGASSVQIRPIAHAQGQTGGWSGSNYIYAYGAQYETGSYPTSYIPTYGTASTRAVDSCIKTGISSLIGQTEGTLFFEFEDIDVDGTTYIASLDNGTVSERIELFTFSGNFGISIRDANVQQVNMISSVSAGGKHKIAFAYKTNDFAFYIDGNLIATDNSGTLPIMSIFNAYGRYDGSNGGGAQNLSQAILFPTRLTNTELAALTTI